MKNATPEQVRLGLRIHAIAFAAGLVLMPGINLLTGAPYWAAWVLPGWGVGLLSHWLGVRRQLPRAVAQMGVALALLACAGAKAGELGPVKSIVLVHGAWADGSGWQGVHDDLRARGYSVSIVQNPLTSLADDVAAVDRVLARQNGPTLLVGHSYGGVVITEAGDAANVAGLVYVAAFVPEAGESIASLTQAGPPPPLQPSADGFLFFDPAAFPQAFAQDLPAAQASFLAASQIPPAGAAFGTPVSRATWKEKRSWYVLSTEDRILPPAEQERMATRAKATIVRVRGSHASYVSRPREVADAIDAAARAAALPDPAGTAPGGASH